MLVSITNDEDGVWEDLVWVNLASASLGRMIYENDLVFLVGRLEGTYTYDTSDGGTNTVPLIDVTQMRLAPTTGVVVGIAHASGDSADATALGIASAFPIEAVITSTPPQSADFLWYLDCQGSIGGERDVQGEKTVALPVVYHLKAPAGSTKCNLLADVTLDNSGSVTVKVED